MAVRVRKGNLSRGFSQRWARTALWSGVAPGPGGGSAPRKEARPAAQSCGHGVSAMKPSLPRVTLAGNAARQASGPRVSRFGFDVGLQFISRNRRLSSRDAGAGGPRRALSLRDSLHGARCVPAEAGGKQPARPPAGRPPAGLGRGGPRRAGRARLHLADASPALRPRPPSGRPPQPRGAPAFRGAPAAPPPRAHRRGVRLPGLRWPLSVAGAGQRCRRGARAVYPAGEQQRPPPPPRGGRAGGAGSGRGHCASPPARGAGSSAGGACGRSWAVVRARGLAPALRVGCGCC